MRSRFALALMALWLACGLTSYGVEVFFTSPVAMVTSDAMGDALGEDVVVELGAFTVGFTPTLANKDSWLANWHTAKREFYNAKTGFYSGTFTLTSNTSPFTTTQRGWIWVYNRCGEWALFGKSTWLWPNASNIFAPPVYWDLSDANQAIIGSVNTGAFDLVTADAGGSPGPSVSFNDWAAMQTGVSAVKSDDSDGDGTSNFAEYAFGSRADDSASLPGSGVVTMEVSGSRYLAARVKRSWVTGVTFSAQLSTDLANWSTAGLVTLQNDATALIVRDSQTIGTGPRKFIRLKAE